VGRVTGSTSTGTIRPSAAADPANAARSSAPPNAEAKYASVHTASSRSARSSAASMRATKS
jgi:hypothetical protein